MSITHECVFLVLICLRIILSILHNILFSQIRKMTGTRGTTQPGQRLAPSERNIHYKAKQARRQKLKEINRQNKERNKENENQRKTSNQRGEEQRAKTSGRKRSSDVLESDDDEEVGNIFGASVPVEG